MTGILCNLKRERTVTENLCSLMKQLPEGTQKPVMVFSLSGINLAEKTVYGHYLRPQGITEAKEQLPGVIYNFSVQHTRKDVKKLRYLMETPDICLINSANVYNQFALLDMISSGHRTKDYIFPYTRLDKDDICFDFSQGNYILKPFSGVNTSKILYLKNSGSGFDIFTRHGIRFCHQLDIQNYIHAYTSGGEWILLRTPELMTSGTALPIIRVYLQKTKEGIWNILLRTKSPKRADISERLIRNTDDAVMNIINFVGCFFTDIGYCYMDFVIDITGAPKFLNFGGWDSSRLLSRRFIGADMQIAEDILSR